MIGYCTAYMLVGYAHALLGIKNASPDWIVMGRKVIGVPPWTPWQAAHAYCALAAIAILWPYYIARDIYGAAPRS